MTIDSVNEAAGKLIYAQATWTVPTEECSGLYSQADFWVGLGGYYDNEPLMQTGVTTRCFGPIEESDAWWEIATGINIASAPHPLGFVGPGDVIFSSVRYDSGHTYTVTLTAKTNSGVPFITFSKPETSPASGYPRSSEVIVERSAWPVANFGKVAFNDVHYKYAGPDNYRTKVLESPWASVYATLGTWNVQWLPFQ